MKKLLESNVKKDILYIPKLGQLSAILGVTVRMEASQCAITASKITYSLRKCIGDVTKIAIMIYVMTVSSISGNEHSNHNKTQST